MYEVERLPQNIDIGYTGEQDFRTIEIDMSAWVAKVPDGQPTLMHIRPGEYEPYPVETTFENNILTWSVSDEDLGTKEGTGLLQVWFGVEDEEQVLRQLGMSAVVATIVHLSIAGEGNNSSTVQIPWLKEVMEMKNIILGYDYEAESWAVGKRGGTDVPSTDPAYHNNAKYFSEQASAAKTAAEAAQEAAETAAERDVEAWLEENFTNPDSPPLDRTLALDTAAAPADMVGNLKSAVIYSNDELYDFAYATHQIINSTPKAIISFIAEQGQTVTIKNATGENFSHYFAVQFYDSEGSALDSYTLMDNQSERSIVLPWNIASVMAGDQNLQDTIVIAAKTQGFNARKRIIDCENATDNIRKDLAFNGLSNVFDGLLSNGYWNVNGVYNPYNGDVCNTNKIMCNAGDTIHIVTTPAISDVVYFISYFNDEGNTRIRRDTGTGTIYDGTAPVGTAYICFTFEKTGLGRNNFESVQVYVNSLSDKLNSIRSGIIGNSEGFGKESTVFEKAVALTNVLPVYHCAKNTAPIEIKLKGISKNFVRVCVASKNALPIFVVGEYSSNGVTVKARPDGSLILNGRTTDNARIDIPLIEPVVFTNGLYSHFRNDAMGGYVEFAYRNSDKQTVYSIAIQSKNVIARMTSNVSNKTLTYINLYIAANLAFDNKQIHPSIESDGLIKPYTPHSNNSEVFVNLQGVTISANDDVVINQSGDIILNSDGTSETVGHVIPPRFSDDECFVYTDDENITSIDIDFLRGKIVKCRNPECNLKANSAAYYGIREGNEEKKKKFSALIMTDVHGYDLNVRNYVEYLNDMNSIDCGINLGDTATSYYDENDGTWYTGIVNKSLKPIYTVIGNHDIWTSSLDASIGATAQAAYEKWIKPTSGIMGFDPENPYYYVLYDKYKIALIVLNSYGTPNNTIVNGEYKTRRDIDAWTQEQANWFVSTLSSIPTDYHLIIAMHDFPNAGGNVTVVDCDWSEPGTYAIAPSNGNVNIGSAIEDTVNAWVNGTTLQRTYPATSYPDLWDASDFNSITINADFTSRGVGIFATYLIGHNHHDGVNFITAYPYQHIAMFTTSCADGYQNYHGDLPRVLGENTEDALSVVVIDTETRTVRLVRIGSTFTTEMTEREYYKFNY